MAYPARSPFVPVVPVARAWPPALVGVALWLTPAPVAAAQAAGAPSALPQSALDRAAAVAADLARAHARRHAPAQARVVALAGTPDPRLKLAPCSDIRAQPSPGALPWGRTRVLLRCAAGPVAWKITLPVTVQVFAPAWVARTALPTGTPLAADALAPAVIDWAASATPPLAPDADAAGRLLARPLAAGEALREADLRARQWFVAGDTVQVTARGTGFAVKAEAQAMSAGIEGRPARLKSSTGRVFSATPVGDRLAEVRL